MTANLNARCAGLWRDADGMPVTIVSAAGRTLTVALSRPHGGYKLGAHVTLPASWLTSDAPPQLPAATVEVDAAPAAAVCALCGRPLP